MFSPSCSSPSSFRPINIKKRHIIAEDRIKPIKQYGHIIVEALSPGLPTPVIMYFQNNGDNTYIRDDTQVKHIKIGEDALDLYPSFVNFRGDNFPADLVLIEQTKKKDMQPDAISKLNNDYGVVQTYRFKSGTLFELLDFENPFGSLSNFTVPNGRWNLAFGRLNSNSADLDIIIGGATLQHFRKSDTTKVVERIADSSSPIVTGSVFPENSLNIVPVLHDLNRDGLLDIVTTFEILGGKVGERGGACSIRSRTNGNTEVLDSPCKSFVVPQIYSHIDAWINTGTINVPSLSNVRDGEFKMVRNMDVGYCGNGKTMKIISAAKTAESCEQACMDNAKCKHSSFSNKPISQPPKVFDTVVGNHNGVRDSNYNGYYDLQGCGSCKDFCRWTDAKPSKSNWYVTWDYNPKKNQGEGMMRWKCDTVKDAGKTYTVKEWKDLNKIKCTENSHTLTNLGDSSCQSPRSKDRAKCDECKGDCDRDDDCNGDLKCFQRDGHTKVPGCAQGGTGDTSSTDYCYDTKYVQGGSQKGNVDISISAMCTIFVVEDLSEVENKYYGRRGRSQPNKINVAEKGKLKPDDVCEDPNWNKPYYSEKGDSENDIHQIRIQHNMEEWITSDKIYLSSNQKLPKLPKYGETWSKIKNTDPYLSGFTTSYTRYYARLQPNIFIQSTKDSYNIWLSATKHSYNSATQDYTSDTKLYNDYSPVQNTCRSSSRNQLTCSTAQYDGTCVTGSDPKCWHDTKLHEKKQWKFQCPNEATPIRVIVGITKDGIYARSSTELSSKLIVPNNYMSSKSINSNSCNNVPLRNLTILLNQGVATVTETTCDLKFHIPLHFNIETDFRISLGIIQPTVDVSNPHRLLNLKVDQIKPTTSKSLSMSGSLWKSISPYVAGIVPKNYAPGVTGREGIKVVGGIHRIGGRNAYMERLLVLPHHVGLQLTIEVAAMFSVLELEKSKYYQKNGGNNDDQNTDNTNYVVVYLDDKPIEKKQLNIATMGASFDIKLPHTNFEAVVKIQVTGNGFSDQDWWGLGMLVLFYCVVFKIHENE